MASDAKDVLPELEKKYAGVKFMFGGEELRRATTVLSAPVTGKMPAGTLQSGDESDFSVRELVLAARQYDKMAEQGADFDGVYHHGLILQELAGKMAPNSPDMQNFLQQACAKYAVALQLQPTSQPALYNWGVALSDLAQVLKEQQQSESRSCLHLASQKYAQCLELNPSNPQALNNWGLVLQDLSNQAGSEERERLVRLAMEKFRAAIRIRPDFDRGCYNLGWVLHAFAGNVQKDVAMQAKSGVGPNGTPVSNEGSVGRWRAMKDAEVRALFTTAAQYICLAYALQPYKDIYRMSLSRVRSLLPLPFLRAGHLTAPLPATMGTMDESWRRDWFVLDHVSLRVASPVESSLSSAGAGMMTAKGAPRTTHEAALALPLLSITTVRRVCDPSLPEGEAFWVGLQGHPAGIYLLADDAEPAEAWVDALLLASALVRGRTPEALADALSPSAKKSGQRLTTNFHSSISAAAALAATGMQE